MKRAFLLALLGAGAGLSSPAVADLTLAASKNCMSCHAVERKVLGPSFKDIAARYKDNKAAPDMLANKIINGGSGAWGQVPMPANKQVNEADAKKLVAWILSAK